MAGFPDPRWQHLCRRAHALGPRPMAEMLAEIGRATGRPEIVAERVEAYAGLDPEIVKALRADRFPPMVVEVAP